MLRNLIIVILFSLLSLPFSKPVSAADLKQDGPSPISGEVLCLPGNGISTQGGCAEFGPSAYVDRMAGIGIHFPMRSIPGLQPDPSLTYVDIKYGEVVRQNAPVYASLEDAIKKGQVARKIDSPYSFISYTEEAVVDGKRYYMVDFGGWMTANDISRIGTPALFQGLNLQSTPDRSFGWILFPVETKRTPGFQTDDYTGKELFRYQTVQIYSVEVVDGIEWYMVRPDEWIPEKQDWQRFVGRVIPAADPPEGVSNGKWIEVNLHEQTIAAYENGQLVFASLIASGIEPFWTKPGLFQIYEKYDATPMRGSFEADRSDAYYLEDVPWTMYYDDARALHGAYWHNGFGAVRSHGCVNLSVGDARWLYDWAEVGDWVYVWDPSGVTPTDPAMYGEGGA